MEYIFILLAVCCIAAQFSFTKLYQRAAGNTAISSFAMLTGTGVVGALFFFIASGGRLEFSPISLILASVYAVIMIPYYMIGIKVLSLGSLAIYSMFMMLGGMLVPFFYGIWFLDEGISPGKIIGTVLIAAFIVLQALSQKGSADKKEDKKAGALFFILCLAIFFINGTTSVITKMHSINENAVDARSFTVTYCAMTAVLALIVLTVICLKNPRENIPEVKAAYGKKPLLAVALLGLAANGGGFLLLKAASKVPASVQYPLVSGGAIVLSALVSVIIFREKISKTEWISVCGAFASTFLFMF